MKTYCCKILLALAVFTSLFFYVSGSALAVPCYVIKRLTNTPDNEFINGHPVINDDRIIAWSAGYKWAEEIFLYDGSTTIQLTNNEYIDGYPEINQFGKVVWYGFDGQDEEIFLYDGTSVTQLTDNSYHDFTPKINSASHVAWRSHDDMGTNPLIPENPEIFYYDGSSVTRITDNLWGDHIYGLSDNGEMVWTQTNSSSGIAYFDGNTIFALSETGGGPYMNSKGHVVWGESFPIPDGSQGDIFLYDGTNTHRITDTPLNDDNPHMNENDHVVWQAHGGNGEDEIFLYNGSDIIQISHNYYDDQYPQISDNGFVVWEGFNGNSWEIFLYDGDTTIQLTNNDYDDSYPQINATGDIAWVGINNKEIFLAVRIFQPTITSPNGGEELIAGTSFEITWASPDLIVDYVKIEYSYDSGSSWVEVVETTENDGSFNWEVPYTLSNECLIRISDVDGNPFDESDAFFTIGPPICRADFDDNKIVEVIDISIFLVAMGEIDCTWWPVLCVCDTDNDDDVDGADLSVLVAEFGRSDCP